MVVEWIPKTEVSRRVCSGCTVCHGDSFSLCVGAPCYRQLRVAALCTQPALDTDDPWKAKNNPDFPLETE